MKKLLFFVLALVGVLVACNKYDDTKVWEELNDHEARISALEKLCREMNTNIASLQSIVTAIQNNDYVMSVTPVKENGKDVGYTLKFSKGGDVTIYHGKDGKNGQDGAQGQPGKDGQDGQNGQNGQDGKDGVTPVVGVKADTDGVYYWTLNGEWLLDDAGNKIPATGKDGSDGEDGADGEDGKDGADGTDGSDGADGADGADGKDGVDGKDGITPQLKIEEGYWYISYDNGVTWKNVGRAAGEDGKDGVNGVNGANGDAFFKEVTEDERFIYLTLVNGTTLTVPRYIALDIVFDKTDLKNVKVNSEVSVRYYVTSNSSSVDIEVMPTNDLRAVCVADDSSNKNGEIVIRTGNSFDSASRVLVFVTDKEKVIMKSISLQIVADSEAAQLYVYNGDVKNVSSTGGVVTLSFLTNVDCKASIPAEAKDWISVSQTKAVELDYIKLNVAQNTSGRRSAVVKVQSTDGKLSVDYTIVQAGTASSSTPSVDANGSIVGKPAANELFYVSTDGKIIEPMLSELGASIINNTYSNGVGVMVFDRNLSKVGGFEKAKKLKEISIPEGVSVISEDAFYGSELEYVTLPSSLRTIAVGAFSFTGLKNVVIPEGVERIDKTAFENCWSLESISIPSTLKTLTNIDVGVFYGCTNLKKVYISDLKAWCEIAVASHYAFPTCYGADLYLNGELLTDVVIPEGTTTVGNFYGCTSITNVTIPEGVTTIAYAAFATCPNLVSVTLPQSLTEIRKCAFENCSSLLQINIPDKVTELLGNTFYGCTSLKKATIGKGLVNHYQNEFYECYNLNEIYIKAQTPPSYKYSGNYTMFYNIGANAKIYVPKGSESAYKNSSSFSNYADKITGYQF